METPFLYHQVFHVRQAHPCLIFDKRKDVHAQHKLRLEPKLKPVDARFAPPDTELTHSASIVEVKKIPTLWILAHHWTAILIAMEYALVAAISTHFRQNAQVCVPETGIFQSPMNL